MKEPYIRISMKHWSRLPWELKQGLLLHLPQVWCIWKPYISWIPKWGRWVPNNVDLK